LRSVSATAKVPENMDAPNAPPELAQFAFLIGKWRCSSSVTMPDGAVTMNPATWEGRYILDGFVIADEFRLLGEAGEVVQLGQNYRCYDRASGQWVMKWLDAIAATWLDLGPEDLGGVHVSDDGITFKHRAPLGPVARHFPPDALFRISFRNIGPEAFSWTAELSVDAGDHWNVVQVIEALRAS
jgi:hypothetical protein